MKIIDQDGNSISGNCFTIITDDYDTFNTGEHLLDINVSSTIIATAISLYIDEHFSDAIVYKDK